MPPASVEPHIKAVLDLLNGSLPANCTAYLGGAAHDATPPYVVLYPDPGEIEQLSMLLDEGLRISLPLHAVGSGPEQALWALDHARTVLIRATPTVTGRVLLPIWQETSPPPLIRDDDVKPPVYVAYAEFGVRSEPA